MFTQFLRFYHISSFSITFLLRIYVLYFVVQFSKVRKIIGFGQSIMWNLTKSGIILWIGK